MIQIADNMFTANEIAMIEKSVIVLPYNINTTDDGNFSSGARIAHANRYYYV